MEWREYFNGVLKGLLSSIIITVLLTAFLSIVMMFMSLSDMVFNVSYVIITCVAIIVGSIIASRKIGKNGWLVGLLLGCVYYISLYLFTLIIGGDSSLGLYDFYRFVIALVVGILSGMLGINLENE